MVPGKGSLAPDWVSAGVTHAGMGVAGARDRVKFGNMYAGNGADYLYVETVESASNASVSDNYAHVWKNTGYGGTTLKGTAPFTWCWTTYVDYEQVTVTITVI